jgi:hypothetical protein
MRAAYYPHATLINLNTIRILDKQYKSRINALYDFSQPSTTSISYRQVQITSSAHNSQTEVY